LCEDQSEYTLVELYLSGLKTEIRQYVEGNLGCKSRQLKNVMDIALVYDSIKFPWKVGRKQNNPQKDKKKEDNQALQAVQQKPQEAEQNPEKQRVEPDIQPTKLAPEETSCFKCKKKGHYKKECPDRYKLRMTVQRANLAISLIADTEESHSQVRCDMIIDSGCTRHMTNRDNLANFKVLQDPERIMIADGSFIMADGCGDYKIGEVFELKDMLHVPDLNKTLISVNKMNDDGFCISFETSGKVLMTDKKSHQQWHIGQRVDNVYFLKESPEWMGETMEQVLLTYKIWHDFGTCWENKV
jgi:hypothetical protein